MDKKKEGKNWGWRNKLTLLKENKKTRKLTYQSLVTKETIDHYISIITNEQEKRNFLTTVSKFDIRISTEPVIRGDEFFYKIWILKRKTKKRAHIKQYFPLEFLNEKKFNGSIPPLSLVEILDMIRINADVPDDFEEYCEIHFKDPSDSICRIDYLDDFRRAARFKKFMSQEDVRSIPSITEDNENSEFIVRDLDEESYLKLLGFSFVIMDDKKEYDKLVDLQTTLDYYGNITDSYGFDKYTNEFNAKLFPITKDDREKEVIKNNIENYNQAVKEYINFLKYLIKKYDIKQAGNITKRIAFNLRNDSKSSQNSKFITTVIDSKYFY